MEMTLRNTEEAVICALLGEANRVPEVVRELTAEMFYTPEFGFIYSAIVALYERGEQPDVVTVDAQMRRTDGQQFEKMGGLSFIADGLMRIRHAENLPAYVSEVKHCYVLRRLVGLFTTLKANAAKAEADAPLILSEADAGLLAIREMQQMGKRSLRSFDETARQTMDYHSGRMEQSGGERCVMTGLTEFDRITGGMHPGELFVGAGRPGHGKSAVALQIALNAALRGKRVCLFSNEMNIIQMMNRVFAGNADVDANRLRLSELTSFDRQKMERLMAQWAELPLYINYTPANTVDNIRAQVMLQKNGTGCDLIIVDYLHLLEYAQKKGELLEQAIARNVRALKNLAGMAACPLLLLSQMNRNSENRADRFCVPQLSDLRDSGTIEQVADCVFFVYRPDKYGIVKDERTGEDLQGIGKLIVEKNRNGSTGTARFRFNTTFTRIENK
jgi:replicative DNA helicase